MHILASSASIFVRFNTVSRPTNVFFLLVVLGTQMTRVKHTMCTRVPFRRTDPFTIVRYRSHYERMNNYEPSRQTIQTEQKKNRN